MIIYIINKIEMKKIFIWWIQWVWKTTISKEISNNNKLIWRFSFWEKIKEIAEKEIANYEKIHLLSGEEREYIVKIARKELAETIEQNKYESILFDNHFTVFREGIIQNTFEDPEINDYDKVIIVSVPINEIKKRITNDKKERVDLASQLDFMENHQKIENQRAEYLSNKYNIELLKVINIDLDKSINEIKNFII